MLLGAVHGLNRLRYRSGGKVEPKAGSSGSASPSNENLGGDDDDNRNDRSDIDASAES